MRWWARALARKSVAWAVVIVVLVLAGLSAIKAAEVDRDDDVLAFLPRDNPAVVGFYDINERFGGLDVAIVGIAVDDPFEADFFDRLKRLTQALNAEHSIAYALSLANVEHFLPDPDKGGIRTDYLVREIPEDPAEREALRRRVMGLDHVVGNLIAPDGKGVIIYAFLGHGASPRTSAALIKEAVDNALPKHSKYWGGAPFISTYIYDITQADMRRLIPWAVLIILLIVIVSFGDLFGSVLALGSTGIGILMAHGLMGASGVNANIVLSSMPVILFAVGSAYGIHVLVRYYALAADRDAPAAMEEALVQVGPTVLAAGLTTVAGLFSFLVMDIKPMREFGLFTGLGILATLLLSLSFVPAVVRLSGLKSKKLGESVFRRSLVDLTVWGRRHRKPVIVALVILSAGAALSAGRVEARMENAAFFSADSPPDRAERFLRDNFGGSQFIQIAIRGDMTDPDVLRELQYLADRIVPLNHVSSVTHVGQVLSMVNDAMVGERRIPWRMSQVKFLYRLLAGKSAVRQLVTDDHQHALLHIKVDTDAHEEVEKLLAAIEQMVADGVVRNYRILGRPPASPEGADDTVEGQADPQAALALGEADAQTVAGRLRAWSAARMMAAFHGFGIALDAGQTEQLNRTLSKDTVRAKVGVVQKRLQQFLRSDESILEEEQYEQVDAIAEAVVKLGPRPAKAALLASLNSALGPMDDEGFVDDLGRSLMTPLDEIWRQEAAEGRAQGILSALRLKAPQGERGAVLLQRIADATLDLQKGSALVAAEGADGGDVIHYAVNGVPVLYRGLSNSVTANQFKSLGLALALVLVIMIGLFRSLWSGLLAAAPTALTLLVIYGVMGWRGVNLDIGTSMLASIIIGAGVDYAVHLLAAWRAEEGEDLSEAARRSAQIAGPAIWTNALMVSAGFFVLTLGEAKPLKNVGGLTAAAMITAALITFVALPALAGRRRYAKQASD